jgi:toxin ParE1/3/4
MPTKRGYLLSTAADHDLEEIFDHTLEEFGLDQAIKYISEFEPVFGQPVKNPEIGRNRNEIKAGLRSFPKESHIVFYRILHDHI